MCSKNLSQLLIESSLDEATIDDLIGLSNRKTVIDYPIKYKGLNFKTKTFRFLVGKYSVDIQLPDYSILSKLKGTDEDKLRLAMEGDVKIYCSCPDFSYGGYKYIADKLDYGTRKEKRPPVNRNPSMKGSICKHLNFLLPILVNFVPDMISSIEKSKKMGYKAITLDKLITVYSGKR